MINYDIFFKRNGVRLPQHLLSPNIPSYENFSFPKSSIHHFTVLDNVVTGPSTHEPLYKDIEKKIFIHHVTEVTDTKGEPRKIALPLEPHIREFHIRNKRFRRAIKLENFPNDENTLCVINYAFITKTSRYMKSVYAEYNRWWNQTKTVWDTVAKTAQVSSRQQFIFLELPKNLPSVARLNNFIDKVNPTFIEYFRDQNALIILEFWKWLDPATRNGSVFAKIAVSDLPKVNVVFQESGRILVLNMGLLNSWIIDKDNKDPTKPKGVLIPDKIRKCFLRMMMSLMEYRTVDATVDEEMINGEDQTPETTEEKTPLALDIKEEPPVATNNTIDHHSQQVEDTETNDFETKFKDIEKDLDQLATIEKESDIENSLVKAETQEQTFQNTVKGSTIKIEDFDIEKTPEQVLKDTCDALADDGLMSAGEYRKYVAQIDKMDTLIGPDGETPVKDFIKINPEDIIIKEPMKFKDKYSVIDKSMLESTIETFDRNYITKVLPKDVTSMPVALQKAGFVISKYDVEVQKDILGETEIHAIKINPIVGKASTLRFKIPKIQPNGEFMVGGTKYRMRKQRGDLNFLF